MPFGRLSDAQIATLKTWIIANVPSPTPESCSAALNGAAAPAYKVYRTAVPMAEIMLNGFDWTRVDNLSVGKARIWEWMTGADTLNQAINPSKTNIRAGINAVWVGTAADLAVRAAVYLHCQRDASVAEKLLKVAGNGTAADANGEGPATLGFDGQLTNDEVIACMP
jgi:hypothetical protein